MSRTSWIALLLACAAPAQQQAAPPPASSWAWTSVAGEDPPRGAFVVGNGRVVGVLGTAGPAHEVRGLRRAHDHAEQAASGTARLHLHAEGRASGWSAHRLERVSGAAICVSEDHEPGGLVLRARTLAPPAADFVVQLVEVRNTASRPRFGVAVRVEVTGRVLAASANLEDGVLYVGELAAGGARRFALTLSPCSAPPVLDVGQVEAAAADTVRLWRARLQKLAEIRSDPPRFAELVDAASVALLALRCEECGGVPADEHSGAIRTRDITGPLLAFLRLGLRDEARDLLRLPYAAARRLGRLPELLPPDPNLDPAHGVDWNALELPSGDLPSRIVLQHYWYWRATADLGPVRAHWPMLEACLKNVPRTSDALVGWSYSESALFVQAVAAMGALRQACGSDGTAWSRRALELLHETEDRYWREDLGRFTPFVDRDGPIGGINLLPLWSGQLAATGNRTRDNLRHTVERLWRSGARVGASPAGGQAEGSLQGMLVCALTQLEGRGRRAALDALQAMAEPAGVWGGRYGADGRAASPSPNRPPVRLSTFATGVNLDAALFAVGGLRGATAPGLDERWIRLRPALPTGTRSVALRGMVADGRRLDLDLEELRDADTGRRLRLSLTLRSDSDRPALAVIQCMGMQLQRYLATGRALVETVDWQEERERFLPGRR